ncbi:hypothetical protein HY745_12205 [Candidatus Desantisbacteria bacterium]|nr:hypothetical protein [Candidatus Desantisbacteria bacterium]
MGKKVLAVFFLLILAGCGGVQIFNSEDFKNNALNMAKEYVNAPKEKQLKHFKELNIKKVVITEFNVIFFTRFNGKEDEALITEKVYNTIVETVQKELGWEVVSREELVKSGKYQSLVKEEYLSENNKSNKDNINKDDIFVLPAKGLGIVSTEIVQKIKGFRSIGSTLKMANNVHNEAGVLEDIGADAAIKVSLVASDHFTGRGGKDNMRAEISNYAGNYTVVDILVGYAKDDVRYSYKETMRFALKSDKNHVIISSVNCYDNSQEIFVNTEKYLQGYNDIVKAFAEMISVRIKNAQ